jgi:hypothetical protein
MRNHPVTYSGLCNVRDNKTDIIYVPIGIRTRHDSIGMLGTVTPPPTSQPLQPTQGTYPVAVTGSLNLKTWVKSNRNE